MQPIRALRRVPALAAGVVAVLLLVCGGLFTHPASAGDTAGMRMAGPPPNGSLAMSGMPGMPGIGGTAGTGGTAAAPAMAMAGTTVTTVTDMGTGSGAGAGTGGGCSASGQDCPLASAYAPTVQAGPAGDLAGSAIRGTQPVADGRPGPVPPPECSRPRAPDLDSLCVSRT